MSVKPQPTIVGTFVTTARLSEAALARGQYIGVCPLGTPLTEFFGDVAIDGPYADGFSDVYKTGPRYGCRSL